MCVNQYAAIGASGDIADFQHLKETIESVVYVYCCYGSLFLLVLVKIRGGISGLIVLFLHLKLLLN